jgi:hypothetical protein
LTNRTISIKRGPNNNFSTSQFKGDLRGFFRQLNRFSSKQFVWVVHGATCKLGRVSQTDSARFQTDFIESCFGFFV